MPLPPTAAITWGPGFVNTWVFPGPVDNPLPSTKSLVVWAEAQSGVRDAWVTRESDQELKMVVRFIPRDLVNGVTGYSTPSGVRDALDWMERNTFRFHSDKNLMGTFIECYLLNKTDITREPGGTHYKTNELHIRAVLNTQSFNMY